MDFKNCYISSNCNQTPTAADCNQNNIIAYGACNSVLIYDSQFGSGGKIIHTLIGHTKRVNSVRWIRGESSHHDQELISGSTDGSLLVWRLKEGKYEPSYLKDDECANILSVNIVDGRYEGNRTIVCGASMNQYSLRIWQRNGNEDFLLQQRCLFGTMGNPSLCVGLRIGVLPQTNKLIIACAIDNSKINIMVESDSDNKWVTCEKLAGHDDWVRGLDFTTDANDLLLASCSQDCFIRLWRITTTQSTNGESSEANSSNDLKISLESVLAGHEGWVYSVNWNPNSMQLLSSSIDKSMIIWEFDKVTGLWLEKIRVGEVGGNTLGFYGGFFNPTGNQIIAYSYHGAYHIWTIAEDGTWEPSVTVGGHFGEVVDLAWEPNGEFLYSASVDQTTRIHAPWKKDLKEVTWHELARPQVHGYDLSSIAVISRYKYASGAEEKVIRTFAAPDNFVDNFKIICQIVEDDDDQIQKDSAFIPKGASVPSLGLSNKAVYTDDNIDDAKPGDNKNPYPEESHFTAQFLTEPPTEETLLQNTLWPEIQKLYGHGYEIFSLAASPDGRHLASACKSTKLQHAAIFIWDTSNWQQIQNLVSHNLTVVQMQFSPDSKHLLSVSRDRRWSLFTKNGENKFELVATTNKETSVHTRIIWTCSWTHDSKYFATGSRDGKLVLWTKNEKIEPLTPLGQIEKAAEPLNFPRESVTAVAFAPDFVNGAYLCAVGLEKGIIEIFTIKNLHFQKTLTLSTSNAHHLTVRKLAFRPKFGRGGYIEEENSGVIQLASCSSDTSVRIYDLIM